MKIRIAVTYNIKKGPSLSFEYINVAMEILFNN